MRKLPVPWKKILTSVPVIVVTVTQWCSSWGFWTIGTLTPTYMNGALHFDVESVSTTLNIYLLINLF